MRACFEFVARIVLSPLMVAFVWLMIALRPVSRCENQLILNRQCEMKSIYQARRFAEDNEQCTRKHISTDKISNSFQRLLASPKNWLTTPKPMTLLLEGKTEAKNKSVSDMNILGMSTETHQSQII